MAKPIKPLPSRKRELGSGALGIPLPVPTRLRSPLPVNPVPPLEVIVPYRFDAKLPVTLGLGNPSAVAKAAFNVPVTSKPLKSTVGPPPCVAACALPVCQTSIRAPSFGICDWLIRTTAAPSISAIELRCLRI